MNALLPVVTLDGPAGVGKTTISRRLADNLGLPYLDTGAMFRCLALRLGPDAENLSETAVRKCCADCRFSLQGRGSATTLACDGTPVGNEIRAEQVGMAAARIAKLPVVREALAKAQRAMGEMEPLVCEGRDMGTEIFPNAAFKFFLDASPEIRAARRLHDLENRGQTADLGALTEQIRQRDTMDRTRAIAPLRPASDAILIDTSHLSIEEVLGTILHNIDVRGGLRKKPRS